MAETGRDISADKNGASIAEPAPGETSGGSVGGHAGGHDLDAKRVLRDLVALIEIRHVEPDDPEFMAAKDVVRTLTCTARGRRRCDGTGLPPSEIVSDHGAGTSTKRGGRIGSRSRGICSVCGANVSLDWDLSAVRYHAPVSDD